MSVYTFYFQRVIRVNTFFLLEWDERRKKKKKKMNSQTVIPGRIGIDSCENIKF